MGTQYRYILFKQFAVFQVKEQLFGFQKLSAEDLNFIPVINNLYTNLKQYMREEEGEDLLKLEQSSMIEMDRLLGSRFIWGIGYEFGDGYLDGSYCTVSGGSCAAILCSCTRSTTCMFVVEAESACIWVPSASWIIPLYYICKPVKL